MNADLWRQQMKNAIFNSYMIPRQIDSELLTDYHTGTDENNLFFIFSWF